MAARQALISRPFKIERPEVASRVEARPDLLGSKVVFFGTRLDGYSPALESGKCWARACRRGDSGHTESEGHGGDVPFVQVAHLADFYSGSGLVRHSPAAPITPFVSYRTSGGQIWF